MWAIAYSSIFIPPSPDTARTPVMRMPHTPCIHMTHLLVFMNDLLLSRHTHGKSQSAFLTQGLSMHCAHSLYFSWVTMASVKNFGEEVLRARARAKRRRIE